MIQGRLNCVLNTSYVEDFLYEQIHDFLAQLDYFSVL